MYRPLSAELTLTCMIPCQENTSRTGSFRIYQNCCCYSAGSSTSAELAAVTITCVQNMMSATRPLPSQSACQLIQQAESVVSVAAEDSEVRLGAKQLDAKQPRMLHITAWCGPQRCLNLKMEYGNPSYDAAKTPRWLAESIFTSCDRDGG